MPDRLTNRRRKEIASLTQRKHRQRLGQMLVEGRRAVTSAVEAGAPLVDVLATEAAQADPALSAVLEKAEAPVYTVSESDLAALSDVETSQGVLAVARTALAEEADLLRCRSVLILDGVQDPGNVGTLLRTAAWFGAEAVVGGPGTAGFFNPKVARAAMGGHWDLRLARTPDVAALLGALRRGGFALYGADLNGVPAAAWHPPVPAQRPSALVLGSEAHGLSGGVRSALDARVMIPGAAKRQGATAGTESLNVAVSAGILIYEWLGRGGTTTDG